MRYDVSFLDFNTQVHFLALQKWVHFWVHNKKCDIMIQAPLQLSRIYVGPTS